MILYTKKKLVIPHGLNPNYNDLDKNPLQDKTADSSTNYQSIYPDEGYSGLSRVDISPYVLDSSTAELTSNGEYQFTSKQDGLSKVDITVNVDTKPAYEDGYNAGRTDQKELLTSIEITENGTYEREDGYNEVIVNTLTVKNQEAVLNSSTNLQEVTPETGYTGLSKVTVNPYTVEFKTVDPSTNEQTVLPGSADAISSVTVNPVTSTIDSNIKSGNIKKDVTILGVTGTFEGADVPTYGPVEFISNEDDLDLVFDTGFVPTNDSKVIAKISFGGEGKGNYGNFFGSQNMFACREWTGYGGNNIAIQMNGTTQTINNVLSTPSDLTKYFNIELSNFKLVVDDKTVSSATQTISVSKPMFLFGASDPNSGNLTELSSRQMRVKSFAIYEQGVLKKNLIPYKDEQGVGCFLESVSGELIYPKQGTALTGDLLEYEDKIADASTNSVTVLPDEGYKALSSVTINPVDYNIDKNIIPENIKSGVEILGVSGNYTGSIFYRTGYVSNNSTNKLVYRNTGIKPTNNTRIEAVLSFEDIAAYTGGYGYFFGTTGNGGITVFDVREQGGYGNRGVNFILDRSKGALKSPKMSSAPIKYCFGQVEGEYSYCSWNGYISKDAVKDLTFSDGNNIFIWAASKNDNKVDEYSSRVMRVYDFKIFEGDSLVFHGIPAIDNEGACVLIDLVTNTVVEGEGTLTGGGVYIEPDEESYIENGTYDGTVSDVYFNLGSGADLYNVSNQDNIMQYAEIIASVPETAIETSHPALFGIMDPTDSKGYSLAVNGTEVNVCAGSTGGTEYGDKTISKCAHNYLINSYKNQYGTYSEYVTTSCSVDGISEVVRTADFPSSLEGNVFLFKANNVNSSDSTYFNCLKGTRIYQFKYYNISDGEVHILVPAYYNSQYCFKDILTNEYVFAESGIPTGNVKDNYKENNGAVLIEQS